MLLSTPRFSSKFWSLFQNELSAYRIADYIRYLAGGDKLERTLNRQDKFLSKCAIQLLGIHKDHRVLDMGCGLGNGLRQAYWEVANGSGVVYGVETTAEVVEKARKKLAYEIMEEKIEVYRSEFHNLPFFDESFDKVYHCSSFYFWPSMRLTVEELYRILKPGGSLVGCLYLDGLKELERAGALDEDRVHFYNRDLLIYLSSLENAGFNDVRVKYVPYKDKTCQAILARKPPSAVKPERTVEYEDKVKALYEDMESFLDIMREKSRAEDELKTSSKP